MSISSVLIVGAGSMAIEYAKIFRAIGITFITVGRGKCSAEKFTAETGLPVLLGGIDAWLSDIRNVLPKRAVVAVNGRFAGYVTKSLLKFGMQQILLEKPGGYDEDDIRSVYEMAKQTDSAVYVGYNRRFYSSTAAAKKIINQDGGATSFHFEFTEWSNIVSMTEKDDGIKKNWFLHNSTHVIDLAFYLGGIPAEISSYSVGSLDWHPKASVFAGAGKTVAGALFSYQANWNAPGRWGVEILTNKHRLIFRPLEELRVQTIGNITVESIGLENRLDREFKPGLYKQVQAFINGREDLLMKISEQIAMLAWYIKILRF